MADSPVKAKFVVDRSGRKSAVLLSVRDFKRLMEAWEEVTDSRDFAKAKRTAKSFISVEALRRRVLPEE